MSTTFHQLNVIDSADLIAKSEDPLALFNELEEKKSVPVFEYLPTRIQMDILNALPSSRVASILNMLSPDDRTQLLENLSPDLINQLLKYLSPEEKKITIKLLGYPENSVGRLMTPDFIAIKMEWTVGRVLEEIKEKGRDSETINVVYAVDDKGTLLDDFHIRQFILASKETLVSDLSDRRYIALNVNENEELALQTFRKYSRVALPVIDAKGLMLGIVTIDDIMKVETEIDTEDIHRVGGLGALKDPYMSVPFFHLIRKRLGWLTILFFGELLTATAMGFFQNEISKAVVLALFLPLIISTGGNAGSQASALIVRALALGEVTLKDWWKVMRREVLSGILLGACLGAIGFFRISLWSIFSSIYGSHHLLLAATVFLSLIGVVLWGTLAGAMLPLILKRLGSDPGVSSAPFVATLVDVTGIVIYFSIAYVMLQGTLL